MVCLYLIDVLLRIEIDDCGINVIYDLNWLEYLNLKKKKGELGSNIGSERDVSVLRSRNDINLPLDIKLL